jgi:biopolymer transport protein ExbD
MKAELTLPERPAAVHLLAVLDILVLLLVFFVLLTSISQEAGISVRLPESSYRLRSYGQPIVVTARGGPVPAIYVGQERIEMEDLEAALIASAERSGTDTMFLYADEMLPHGIGARIVETGLGIDLNVAQAGRQRGDGATSDETAGSGSPPAAAETNEKTEP